MNTVLRMPQAMSTYPNTMNITANVIPVTHDGHLLG